MSASAVPQSLPQPQYVRLHNGRALAYLDVGPRDAPPVMHFHGIPCSRLEALWEADSCRELGVRVICPDRPGYGLSDHLPDRSLLDWPADVTALADALGLGRFGVLGVLGGGPVRVGVRPRDARSADGRVRGVRRWSAGQGGCPRRGCPDPSAGFWQRTHAALDSPVGTRDEPRARQEGPEHDVEATAMPGRSRRPAIGSTRDSLSVLHGGIGASGCGGSASRRVDPRRAVGVRAGGC